MDWVHRSSYGVYLNAGVSLSLRIMHLLPGSFADRVRIALGIYIFVKILSWCLSEILIHEIYIIAPCSGRGKLSSVKLVLGGERI